LAVGGHLDGDAVDVLWSNGKTYMFPAQQTETRHAHGSGSVLSAAITARLAYGNDIVSAVTAAKRFITDAIRTCPGLGSGSGPVNMHAIAGPPCKGIEALNCRICPRPG